MSIIRSKRASKFTVIGNHIFESGLSWKAVGVLAYLLSKPDDWSVSVAQLVKHTKKTKSPLGRDGVYSVLGELKSSGYVQTKEVRNVNGMFVGTDYIVSDEPFTANPDTAQPFTANPTLTNTDPLISNDYKQTSTSQAKHDQYDFDLALNEWNKFAEANGLAKINLVGDKRERVIKQSYQTANKLQKKAGGQPLEFSDFVVKYLTRAHHAMTDFHRGEEKGSKWKANFNYVFAKDVTETLLTEGELRR